MKKAPCGCIMNAWWSTCFILILIFSHCDPVTSDCIPTTMRGETYWMVDLGNARPRITRVVVGEEGEGCCAQSIQRLSVRIGDEKNHTLNPLCYDFLGPSGPRPVDEMCSKVRIGRHVSVQLSLTDPYRNLSVCSIYLYATDLVGGEYLVTSVGPDFVPGQTTPPSLNPKAEDLGEEKGVTASVGDNATTQVVNIRMVTTATTYNEIWVIATIIGIVIIISLILVVFLTAGQSNKRSCAKGKSPHLNASDDFHWRSGDRVGFTSSNSWWKSDVWDQFSFSTSSPQATPRAARWGAARDVSGGSSRPITVTNTDPGARNQTMYENASLMLEPLEFEFDGLRRAINRTSFQSIKHPYTQPDTAVKQQIPDTNSTARSKKLSASSQSLMVTVADVHRGKGGARATTMRTPSKASKVSDDSGFNSPSEDRKKEGRLSGLKRALRKSLASSDEAVDVSMNSSECDYDLGEKDMSLSSQFKSSSVSALHARSRSYTDIDFDSHEAAFSNGSYYFGYQHEGNKPSSSPTRSKSYCELKGYDWSEAAVGRRKMGLGGISFITDLDALHRKSERFIPTEQLAARMRSLQSLASAGDTISSVMSDNLSELGLEETMADYNYYNFDSHRESIHI